MKIKFLKLEWDSDFFGYQVGRAEIEELKYEQYEDLVMYFRESSMRLIYIYPLDKLTKSTLLKHKIPLLATNVNFEKYDNFSQKKITSSIKSFDENDKFDEIEKLAYISGEFSRFKLDRNYSDNEFYRLYSEWIKKSISKEIATDVIIYKNVDKIKGFISYKITSIETIVIGLIAVDSFEQGQGIGKSLIQSVENVANVYNIKKIMVSTQLENEKAVKFYNSCGYKLIEQKEIYHLWI